MKSKRKILVVANAASIHAARFVSLLQEIGYEVRVFQSDLHCDQDEHLKNTVVYVPYPFSAPQNNNKFYMIFPFQFNCWRWRFFLKYSKACIQHRTRVDDLICILKKWDPHIVFSLKMQNEGYITSQAKLQLKELFKAKWIHYNWGTDIEFFGKDPLYKEIHLPQIRNVLENCDFHIADCRRDAKQAFDFGFKGTSLGTSLAPGGFDISELQSIRKEVSQDRKVILIKGREGDYVGKAFNVLRALRKIPELTRGYKIRIILASQKVKNCVDILSFLDNVEYKIIPRVPYRYLLGLFASSRIAISASTVDGTPSFLTEAMAMGAFPIHSNMDSIREWITPGENGLLFPVDDIDALTETIKESLRNDSLVENARELNWKIAKERMDRSKIRLQIKDILETHIQ